MDADLRRLVRFATAAGVAAAAVIYLLIGLGVISVIEDQAAEPGTPMFMAAALFSLLAVALLISAGRPVVLAGAALQVLVIVGYVVVAANRTPAFEAWGIGMKVLEVALLAGFVSLAITPKRTITPGQSRPQRTLTRV